MSPNIIPLTLGPLQANCYLVIHKQKTLIIDPGGEGDFISQTITENNLKPSAILLTHAHFDHVLGILPLKLNFQVPIILPQKDLFLYQQANKSSAHWTGTAGDPLPPPDKLLDSSVKQIFSFQVIPTPGHTPGSICLYDKKNQIIFTGDTLFKQAVGRTDFSYSSPKDLQKSLSKLLKLPSNTKVYPGHGDPTTIKQEKNTLKLNPLPT